MAVIDWFWQRAVIPTPGDGATLYLSTGSRVQGGHCAGWLRIPRVVVAYTGEDSIPDVSSAAMAAAQDVAPLHLTPGVLTLTRMALQDGEPSWVPSRSEVLLRQREEHEERRAAKAKAQASRVEEVFDREALREKKRKEVEADRKRAAEEREAAKRRKTAEKGKAKKAPFVSEYLRQQSAEETAAWENMMAELRRRRPGASQEELDAHAAAALARSFEGTELQRRAVPPAEYLAQPAISVEDIPSQSLFPTPAGAGAGEGYDPLSQVSEDVEQPPAGPYGRAVSSTSAIAGLQQRLDAAQAPETQEEMMPLVPAGFRVPSSKPRPLGLPKPRT